MFDNSRIIANAVEGDGGNIGIITQGYFISGDSLVSASSELGLDGNIEVDNLNGDRKIELETLPENPLDITQQIAASCEVGANQFAILGKGGLPENPTQNLRGQAVWQDIRIPIISNTNKLTKRLSNTIMPIIEAETWKVNQQGKTELVASADNNFRFNFNYYQCKSN